MTPDRLARRLAAGVAFLVVAAVTLAAVPALASTVARPTKARIDNNSFGIESNPDGTAPACPAN